MIINTTIKIGHASTSNPKSGLAADEVLISDLYSSFTPTVLLRPKNGTLAERSAKACEAGCNNNKIEYSQSSRNTLNAQAKNVNYNLSAIASTCYSDCSSFMTVCAIAGGATFSYEYGGSGSNAPTTRNMKNWFTSTGDYTALTDSQHLDNTDYLKRGDILVAEGSHTLMILSNGPLAPVTSSTNSISLMLDMNSTDATSVSARLSVYTIENNTKELLSDLEVFNLFNWQYKLELLSTGAVLTNALSVSSGSVNFSIDNLTYDSSYKLSVEAVYKEGDEILSSSCILFKTLKVCPMQVKNLLVELDENIVQDFNSTKCNIYFTAPTSWGDENINGFVRGYRTSLVLNGQVVAYKDNLFNTTNKIISQNFSLSDIIPKNLLEYNDTVQIGIQAWLKDSRNNIILDGDFPRCSRPIFLKYFLTTVDKLYIKTQNDYKKAILYNKEVN